mgnify:FL=1
MYARTLYMYGAPRNTQSVLRTLPANAHRALQSLYIDTQTAMSGESLHGVMTLLPHPHNDKAFPPNRCHNGGVSGGLLMHFGRNAITLRPKRTSASAESRTQERFSAPSGKHFQKDSTNKEKCIAGNIYVGVQNPLQGLVCGEKSLYLRN